MNRMNPKRLAVFFLVFATIAIAICALQSAKEQQRAVTVAQQQRAMANQAAAQRAAQDAAMAQAKAAQDEAARQALAAKEAAEKHAQFLTRYVNPDLSRNLGGKSVAIVAVSENGNLNSGVADAIASRFKTEPVEFASSLFKPAFVADGLFQTAFNGSGDPFVKLDLTKSLNGAVLAQQDVQYAQNSTLENVLTATMTLKVAVMPVSGQSNGKPWTFTAYGPGFTKEVARQAAEERLIKQIITDTNMSLDAITSNH